MNGYRTYFCTDRYTLETIYRCEYVDDPNVWNRICDELGLRRDQIEPWELYSVREYTDPGEALSFYIVSQFNDRVFDIRLFVDTKINGETVCEEYIDLDPTIYATIASMVDKSRESEIDALRRQNADYVQMNGLYDGFVKSRWLEKLFDTYIAEVERAKKI